MAQKEKESCTSGGCPCSRPCPLQRAMQILGGRWKFPILCVLAQEGPIRYNDLKRKTIGISNTMLARSLRELETDGLITRAEYAEVPVRVEYAMTEAGRELIPIASSLGRWGAALPAGEVSDRTSD